MLLPISWLKQFLPTLPTPKKLAEVVTMHGLDVESILQHHNQFEKVVVGEIIGIKSHPNADKLRLVDVVVRPGARPQEIVCGAPNIAVGQKVPVALLGAKLPNGLTIEARKIRGIESHGMICAEDELGLEKNHSGVMILDPQVKVGTPFAQVIGSDDVVLDLTTPANRADLMAIRGLAWEIGAMIGKTPKFVPAKLREGKPLASSSITVSVADSKLVPVYSLRVIRGATVGPSPADMQKYLRAVGMRSINNVVDTTNFMMWIYGQPLHAFDAAKVRGPITVRLATSEEHLITLDGKDRKLDPSMLIIADTAGPIALAGVMGGRDTEVTEATKDILLESAIFDPVSIRKTSRHLGLVSEASKRFEKGLWPSLPEQASAAAAQLMTDLAGGMVEQGSVTIDVPTAKHSAISFDPVYVTERLGMKVSAAKVKTTLTKLGFVVSGGKTWSVSVPEWRPDVSLPEDLVDEVGRMIGYEKLPKQMPSDEVVIKEISQPIRFKEEVKNILVDMGLTEIISHAFYSEGKGKIVKGEHFIIENPLDVTQHLLRKSLRPQMFDVLDQQAKAGKDAKVFELGRIFDPKLPGSIEKQQPWKLAMGVCNKDKSSVDSYVRQLQEILKTKVSPEGQIHSLTPTRGRDIFVVEFDVATLRNDAQIKFGHWNPHRHISKNAQYRQQSKYPAVTRDIAFWWPHDEKTIGKAISGLGIDVLREFTIKDRFTKDGRTSFAVSFVYQSPDRTLTKVEVDELEGKMKTELMKLGATIR